MLLTISCCRSLGDCTRRDPLILKTIGFSQSELDTIIVTKYKKNSGFISPVSTFTTRNQLIQYFYYSTSPDTTYVQVDHDFTSDFDWAIKVKSANHEIRLESLVYKIGTEVCQGWGAKRGECSNYLISVTVDGRDTLFDKGQEYHRLPFFLLKK